MAGPIWGGILDRYFPGIGQRQRDEQFSGLLGNPTQHSPQQGMSPRTGSGLLGGAYSQDNFLQQMGKIGGRYADATVGSLQAAQQNRATQGGMMDRLKYSMDNIGADAQARLDQTKELWNQISPYQQAGLDQQSANNAATQGASQNNQQIAQTNAAMDDLRSISKEGYTAALPYKNLVDSWEPIEEDLIKYGLDHDNSALDTRLMVAFTKGMKPNEAINDGDIKMVMDSMGWGMGTLQSVMKTLGAGGTLDKETRQQIAQATQQMATSAVTNISQIRNRLGPQMQMTGASEGMMGSQLPQVPSYKPQPLNDIQSQLPPGWTVDP